LQEREGADEREGHRREELREARVARDGRRREPLVTWGRRPEGAAAPAFPSAREEEAMRERGFSLVEMVVVVAIMMVLAAVCAPSLKAYAVDAHLLGAGRQFKQQFLLARSRAVRSGVQTAIRF